MSKGFSDANRLLLHFLVFSGIFSSLVWETWM